MTAPTLFAIGAAIGVYLLGLGGAMLFVRGLDGPAASRGDLWDRVKVALWWPVLAGLIVIVAIGAMLPGSGEKK